VFCTKWDEAELTRGLGEEYVVNTTKRYPCHATAHAAVSHDASLSRSTSAD